MKKETKYIKPTQRDWTLTFKLNVVKEIGYSCGIVITWLFCGLCLDYYILG